MPHSHKCTACGAEWICGDDECTLPPALICQECALEALEDYDDLEPTDNQDALDAAWESERHLRDMEGYGDYEGPVTWP